MHPQRSAPAFRPRIGPAGDRGPILRIDPPIRPPCRFARAGSCGKRGARARINFQTWRRTPLACMAETPSWRRCRRPSAPAHVPSRLAFPPAPPQPAAAPMLRALRTSPQPGHPPMAGSPPPLLPRGLACKGAAPHGPSHLQSRGSRPPPWRGHPPTAGSPSRRRCGRPGAPAHAPSRLAAPPRPAADPMLRALRTSPQPGRPPMAGSPLPPRGLACKGAAPHGPPHLQSRGSRPPPWRGHPPTAGSPSRRRCGRPSAPAHAPSRFAFPPAPQPSQPAAAPMLRALRTSPWRGHPPMAGSPPPLMPRGLACKGAAPHGPPHLQRPGHPGRRPGAAPTVHGPSAPEPPARDHAAAAAAAPQSGSPGPRAVPRHSIAPAAPSPAPSPTPSTRAAQFAIIAAGTAPPRRTRRPAHKGGPRRPACAAPAPGRRRAPPQPGSSPTSRGEPTWTPQPAPPSRRPHAT